MISITIQCSCGQDIAFDVEPIEGRMPSGVECPTCGIDVTERSNEEIQRQLTPAAPSAPAEKSDTLRVVGACVAALALLALVGGAFLWWKSRNEKTTGPEIAAAAPQPEIATPEPAASAAQPEAVSAAPEPETAVSTPESSAPAAQIALTAAAEPSKVARDPSFVGVGAMFDPDSKTEHVKIVKVMANSPAKNAGIVAGDMLVSIDDMPIKELRSTEIADKFFGPVGSKVTMRVISSQTGQTNVVKMTRKKYH